MADEKRVYQILKDKVFRQGDRIDRVENVLLAGVPDANACADGVEFWIEIKAPSEPKRLMTPLFGSNHRLSQAQMNWIYRQVKAGGKAFVLIATQRRWMLIDGVHADQINGLNIPGLLLICSWHRSVPIKQEGYDHLRESLCTK